MFPKIIHLSETTTKEKLIMLIASIVGNVLFFLNYFFMRDYDWILPLFLIIIYVVVKSINEKG
jgi:hypothetical protein